MKRTKYSIFIILFALLCPSCNSRKKSSHNDREIIAELGEEVLYTDELNTIIKQELFDELNKIYEIKKKAVEQLINVKLLQKEADKKQLSYMEETVQALIDMVKQGKTLYIGISKYPPEKARVAYEMMKAAGTPCLISQYRYSMFDRAVEAESLALAAQYGSGFIAFSPLAQGLLTDKYLHGIPENSRAARATGFLKADQVTADKVRKAARLNEIAVRRGQTLAEMALAWVLRDERMTSVIVGASSVKQLNDNLHALENLAFLNDELAEIEGILRS